MSQRYQTWVLKNTQFLQYVVNERLAKRSGFIGRVFKSLEMGPRQYSQHSMHRVFRVGNWFWLSTYHVAGVMRPVLSRLLIGVSNGPLNYTGLFMWFWLSLLVVAKFKFTRARDVMYFNA